MSTMLNLRKDHHHLSHKRAARTNFYHEFSLDRVSLEFHVVSSLIRRKTKKDKEKINTLIEHQNVSTHHQVSLACWQKLE